MTDHEGVDRLVAVITIDCYNLAEDVTETKNLADKNPEIVKELTDLHKRWAAEVTQ